MELDNTYTIESKKQQIDTIVTPIGQNVSTIILKGNSYSKIFFEAFGKEITNLKDLQKLNLNDIFVGRGKEEIPESLHVIIHNEQQYLGTGLIGLNIISIDLSNNAVNPYGADALKPFLKQAHTLQKLYLNNCGLGIKGITHIAEGLSEGGLNLQVLALARNRAECQGAQAVSKALANLVNLKELHIYQNGIKQDGMIPLIENLQHNKNLQLVDVRDNFIHLDTTPHLVNLIPRLQGINISDCNIQTEQNDSIIEALDKVETLVRLGYNYAELSDVQGQKLLPIIEKHKQTIVKLELKGNDELKKATITKFRFIFQNKNNILGAFDSDEENEDEDELAKLFSQLEI
ncbi:hypothetical protein pb186bvf_000938 [Paramecium bursaria]